MNTLLECTKKLRHLIRHRSFNLRTGICWLSSIKKALPEFLKVLFLSDPVMIRIAPATRTRPTAFERAGWIHGLYCHVHWQK